MSEEFTYMVSTDPETLADIVTRSDGKVIQTRDPWHPETQAYQAWRLRVSAPKSAPTPAPAGPDGG